MHDRGSTTRPVSRPASLVVQAQGPFSGPVRRQLGGAGDAGLDCGDARRLAAGRLPPTAPRGHAVDMVADFIGAAIAGFLLPTVPNWTGRRRCRASAHRSGRKVSSDPRPVANRRVSPHANRAAANVRMSTPPRSDRDREEPRVVAVVTVPPGTLAFARNALSGFHPCRNRSSPLSDSARATCRRPRSGPSRPPETGEPARADPAASDAETASPLARQRQAIGALYSLQHDRGAQGSRPLAASSSGAARTRHWRRGPPPPRAADSRHHLSAAAPL